jgi:hypothetical protein
MIVVFDHGDGLSLQSAKYAVNVVRGELRNVLCGTTPCLINQKPSATISKQMLEYRQSAHFVAHSTGSVCLAGELLFDSSGASRRHTYCNRGDIKGAEKRVAIPSCTRPWEKADLPSQLTWSGHQPMTVRSGNSHTNGETTAVLLLERVILN